MIVHIKPEGAPLLSEVESDEDPWRQPIAWPKGALTAKASLYYAGEEINSISLRRWPEATTVRAAVDCFFDPGHKRLNETLLGKGCTAGYKGKTSESFEHACVRLMNLLGVPLVWYGGKWAQPGRNDAAGVVLTDRDRMVVLAECTAEKPEAKFSAVQTRSQQLAEDLPGEAEVLPVVFTQIEPGDPEFENAKRHGIALVGREQLEHLLTMLSSTPPIEDALSYLCALRHIDPLATVSFGGSY